MVKLIVGLGNPGAKYSKTRHNAGFMAVDAIAAKHSWGFASHKKTDAQIAKAGQIILAKPQLFMNNSGRAVAKLVNYFKVGLGGVLVVYDDVDLPVGAIRFRKQGSSAGHKGMQSVIDALGTDTIKRIRIGVGKSETIDTDKYVLQRFSTTELRQVQAAIRQAADLALSHI